MVFKKKNQIPDMDELIDDHWYAFTINPSDKHQYFNQMERMKKSYTDLTDSILFYKGINIKLYMEISKKGRIHYHGLLQIRCVFQFYLYIVPHLLRCGTICIKPLPTSEDSIDWEVYCNKNSSIMEEECKRLLIPYPIYLP